MGILVIIHTYLQYNRPLTKQLAIAMLTSLSTDNDIHPAFNFIPFTIRLSNGSPARC